MAEIDTSLPPNSVQAEKARFRNNWLAVAQRIGTLRTSWLGLTGMIMSVRKDQAGLDVPDGAVSFNGQPVRDFTSNEVPILSDATLSDVVLVGHKGCLLKCVSSNTITLLVTTVGGVKVSPGFRCQIWNMGPNPTTSIVQVSFGSGVTNRNPDGATKVQYGRMADLYVAQNGDVYFDGGVS